MVPGRKLPLEVFHQLTVTEDQLNTVAYALRTLQDQLELERSNDPGVEETLQSIDEIMISIDGTR